MKRMLLLLGLGMLCSGMFGCVVEERRDVVVAPPDRVEYVVGHPAPREIVEVRTKPPRERAEWVRGHWEVRGHYWVWSHGYWR